ncbi:MAG: hypothetical protein KBT03_02930 [Bacteroidales bacterium]|nr:hypothetical protein [Candidatus Scybalousia scybalohippi]
MNYNQAIETINRLKDKQFKYANVDEVYADLENLGRFIQDVQKQLEISNKTLEKAVEEINKGVDGISHCPKGRDCLYDDWIEERNCNKCWSDYLLAKATKELENGK